MYGSKTFIIVAFFLVARHAMGQEEMNSAMVERKSYQLYVDKKWDELIPYGRNAIQEGYDYFYLRLRLGIALYEKEQFRVAATHFEKALRFNSGDELTLEYLYFSLIFSDRFDEARKLSETFGDALSAKIGQRARSPIAFISAEGGLKMSSRNDLFNPAFYFQLGVGHTVGNKFSVYHAATVYTQNESRGDISQFQYFIQPSIPVGRHWTLTPSVHIVSVNFQKNNGLLQSAGMVGSLSIAKSCPYFDISIGGTVSNVLTSLQYIQQSRLAIYPSGKPNFSFGVISYLHSEDDFLTSTLAINPFVYWRPVRKVGFYANYFMNKYENIAEMNGYLVNNSPDLTLSRTSALLSLEVNRHWQVYTVYQFENKQEFNSIAYSYNVFLIGLKFKP